MNASRRELLFGLFGVVAGGALATTTGLGIYYTRKSRKSKKIRRPENTNIDDWLLTEADRKAITSGDALVRSGQFNILDATDFPGGGGYNAFGVSRLGDCIKACEADERCESFTFARSTHPSIYKRQMCWLKSEQPRNIVTDTEFYVSGHRLKL